MELGLPQQEVDDVTAVIQSMRADCIIQDGETPPTNPGHAKPSGDSLYARCGGVYPIALVCDRLVDALLSDKSVRIKVDAMRTMAVSCLHSSAAPHRKSRICVSAKSL